MLNWLKEFFGIGLNSNIEEVKQAEAKAFKEAAASVSPELKEVETKIAEAIKAETKPTKKAKAAAPKAKAKNTKKNAKK